MKNSKDYYNTGGGHPLIYHPFVLKFIPEHLGGKTIADLGCGKGIYGFLIRAIRNSSKARILGIDINKENIKFVKKFNIYDKILISILPKLDVDEKSINYVICSEVLEHLNKEQGSKLLDKIDHICNEMAIVTTPNILFQPTGNENYDRHESVWSIEEFRKRGYKVYGIGIKIAPPSKNNLWAKFFFGLEYVMTPISWIIPEIAGGLIAVKYYYKDI